MLAGTTTSLPKGADGEVEMIHALRTTRHSTVKARTQAENHMKAMLVTALEVLSADLRELSTSSPRVSWSSGRHASGSVSARCRDSRDHVCVALRGPPLLQLSKEISEFDEHLGRLVAEAAPELIAVEGVGTDTTASLLIAAADNPERLSSKAAFAHLCGVTPIPASFGKIVRPRLHRRGNGDARAEPSTRSLSAA